MHNPNANNEYMLLFRGTKLEQELSPQQIQDMMTRWVSWYDGLVAEGKALAGQPLTKETRVVSGKSRHVADGPFAESKEAVGGYFLLKVADFDEAVEIAKGCPGLDYGLRVEVRQIAERCALEQSAEDRPAFAGATA